MYLFGRVISTTAKAGPDMPAILIYIYSARSDRKGPPPLEQLTPRRLLVPPLMTNRRPWTEGYFENILRRTLEVNDVLPQHCFRANGKLYDELSREIDRPAEPCGIWGLESFRTIDDGISMALGIPLSPD
jgi:Immunity protein 26